MRARQRADGKGSERGSIQVLLLGYVLLLVVVAAVVSAGTSLYLERERLLSLADATALAASESFPLDSVGLEDGALTAHLDSSAVAQSAHDYLVGGVTEHYDGLAVVAAGSPDGRSAEVTLSAVWRPPLVSPYLPLEIPVTVTSHARVLFR